MSDQFVASTQQNLLTGGDGAKLYGWNLLNSAHCVLCDVNISNVGYLTFNADGVAAPTGATFSAPFMFQNITGDFDISITSGNVNHGIALLARDPSASAGEDWLGLMLDGETTLFNTVNSSRGAYSAGGTQYPYYRLARSGNVFMAYTRLNGTSWAVCGFTPTRNDFSSTIQVGILVYGSNSSGFDYFQGTNGGGVTAATTALTSNTNPASVGVQVTFTATVTGITPTGTVTFKDGATTLGTGTLNGSYQATYATSALSGGTHSITAVYGGDANNMGSTSAAVTQVILAASGVMAMPVPVLTSYIQQVGNFADMGLPIMAVDSLLLCANDSGGDVFIPLPIVAATWVDNFDSGSTLTIPVAVMAATLAVGNVGSMIATLPAPVAMGQGGLICDIDIPMLQVAVSGVVGSVATLNAELPLVVVDAFNSMGSVYNSDLTVPMFGVSSDSLTGNVAIGDDAIPMPTFIGVGCLGNTGDIAILWAVPVVSAGLFPAITYSGNIVISIPDVHGTAGVVLAGLVASSTFVYSSAAPDVMRPQMGDDTDIGVSCYCLNIKTGAITQFNNFRYNSIVDIGNVKYGASDSGLFRVLGDTDTDNGSAINAHIKTGVSDMGTPFIKGIPAAYVGLRGDGHYSLGIITDDDNLNSYPLESHRHNTHQVRALPGRGLKGRYYQVQVANVNGESFELDNIELVFNTQPRRVSA